ncbi:hypothetical protein B0J14DRAFT_71811 [Halenospora varia]|nr:hypothetical protein B0J14DRAFT_71811 [Halenospora varia]
MKCRLDYLDSHGDFIFMDPEDPHLVSIRQKMKLLTERLETKRIPLRQAAWEAGCSFDNVDTIWYEEDGFRNKQESTEYYPTLLREDRNLTLEATAWCTQTDRINFWMLQCLASSQEQEALHRAFLSKASEPEALSEKEWARLVLKFWPLDEAAKWAGDRTSSTNGAVDSNGAFHSARVSFKSGGISKQKIASDAIDAEVEEKLRRK